MGNKRSCFWVQFLIIGMCLIFIQVTAVFAGDNAQSATQTETQKTRVSENTGGSLTFSGDMAGRLNPKGLGFSGRIKYRDVYQYSEKYDTASAYWQTGMGLNVSPAYGQADVHVEWLPWIFLSLRAEYDYYRFFGSYGSLLSFSSAKEPFGDDVVDDRTDEESTSGQRFMFQPTLQGKIDRFIIRNQTVLAYYRFSGRGPYFLEQEYYTLLKDRDRLISNQTQVLYQVLQGNGGEKTLLIGPYFEITRADKAEITQQKIGGLLYWVPKASMWGLDRPRMALKAGYHLKDPDRQGEMFVAFDLGFDLDL
jgi:hypothetical protein